MHRTFEFDDYPMSHRRIIRNLDTLKERYPNFKASVFAIPGAMTDRYWKPLLDRREWIETCPHGLVHQKRECRLRGIYTLRLHWLDMIAQEDRYTKLFKAPWHGIDQTFMQLLRERGMDFCFSYMSFRVPYPTPEWLCWNIKDARRLNPFTGYHVEAHAIVQGRHRKHNRRHQQIDSRNFDRLINGWDPGDKWDWVSDLKKPMLKKLYMGDDRDQYEETDMSDKVYLGCGPHVKEGWDCLDNRTELHPDIIYWEAPDPLPIMDERVDVVMTSHLFNYLEDEWYAPLCREIYRVLRPGGIARLSEDATESGYIWRRPGQSARKTGVIRSLPTRRKVLRALRSAGFQVRLARPGRTQTPHLDVLEFDTRLKRWKKGEKYYLEGTKVE